MKMTITCEPWQQREIIKACINSGECPIDGMCGNMDCDECLATRIDWNIVEEEKKDGTHCSH